MCRRKTKTGAAGFTLVELMVTVAIMAIIAGLTFGNMNTASYRLKSKTKILIGSLQRARLEAVKKNANVSIKFDRDGDGNADHGYDIVDALGNQIISVNNKSITFTPTNLTITFTPIGTCNAGNITLVSNGTSEPEYKITFNNVGRVKFAKTK